MQAACLTDQGLVRAENQDACAADVKRGIFVVADGVGGANAGAVAAKAVVKVLPGLVAERVAALSEATEAGIEDALKDAIADLSNRVKEQTAANPELRGMSATVVMALVRQRDVYIAHAGDSRAYLFRPGRFRRRPSAGVSPCNEGEECREKPLEQLTRDHSVVAVMVELGQITPEQARVHPMRNRITRCVGMEGSVVADVQHIQVKPGYRLLLCTDGLTGMLADAEIERILKQTRSCKTACRRLVDEANRAGGADNITALVVDFRGQR